MRLLHRIVMILWFLKYEGWLARRNRFDSRAWSNMTSESTHFDHSKPRRPQDREWESLWKIINNNEPHPTLLAIRNNELI
jgi:hypothetical protein